MDYQNILRWSLEQFGVEQAVVYRDVLNVALRHLRTGPKAIGTKARNDIAPGLFTFHISRRGKRARHFILFRGTEPQTIDVLRILHDGMDLTRHLTEND